MHRWIYIQVNDGNEEEGSRQVAMNVKFLMEYIIALVEG